MNITFFLRGGILETVVMLNSWWSQRYRWTGGSRQAPVPDRQCCPLYHFFSNATTVGSTPQTWDGCSVQDCCLHHSSPVHREQLLQLLLPPSLFFALHASLHNPLFFKQFHPHILPTDVPLPQPSRLLRCSSEHLSSGLVISRMLSCGHQAIEPYATCHFCDTPLM